MSHPATSISEDAVKAFLTFKLGEEIFGMELSKTREVIEYGNVTSVPLMPSFLHGVINLRGEVVPVIDLAVRLGRPPLEIRQRSCIVIIEIDYDDTQFTLGLLADSVCEVNEIPEREIEDAPAFGAEIRAEFILGIAKQEQEFIVLLNASKALSVRELAKLVEQELE